MTRSQTVLFMNSHTTNDQMFGVVREYIKEMKDVDFNPRQVDLYQLQRAYKVAMEYYMRKFHVNILHDKNNKIVKIF